VKGQLTPVVTLEKLGTNCSVWSQQDNPWQKVNSMQALRTATQNSYFSEPGRLHLKMRTVIGVEASPIGSPNAKPAESRSAMIQCD
jgi:hypothetical protein